MRKIIKFLLVFLFLVFVLLCVLITRIDRTPFLETSHFKQWENQIRSQHFSEHTGDFQMGWAMENITPAKTVPLAGYGKRRGKHFENVHDSIYVRSIALQNSAIRVYLVSADLLFIPPKVVKAVEQKLSREGISLRDVHFSCTHSHNSIGGWESTLTGELFGGKYDPEVVEMLAEKFYRAIVASGQDLSDGNIYYSEIADEEDVRYRINLPDGVRDTEIRSLSFAKQSGEKAYLITYSAHSTVLSDKILDLSRDYSGALVDSLRPHFGVFMAGAVASMGPIERGMTEFDELKNQAMSVLYYFNKREEKLLDKTIISEFIKVPLPEPTGRITRNLALRPWVFKKFFGDYDAYIKVTKIGKTLILGMPADFSGEIMVELDEYARKKGLDLIVTGFNGGYIGYITPDKIYDSGIYETVTMSWYGFQNGGYFTKISKDIIDRLAE